MGTQGIKTRQQIVTKSLQLFSVKGYFNTSISDILEATDLTKGGLYGHFGSKEDIWKAVYAEAVLSKDKKTITKESNIAIMKSKVIVRTMIDLF